MNSPLRKIFASREDFQGEYFTAPQPAADFGRLGALNY